MPNTAFLWTTWILGTVIEVSVLTTLFWRRLQFEWPSVATLCVVDLAADIAFATTRNHYATYFYTYWTWFLIAACLRFWILFDVIRSFPGIAFMRRQLRTSAAIAGLCMMTFAWWFGSLDGPAPDKRLRTMALAVDSSVLIGWAAFVVAFLVVVFFFRVLWSRPGLLITLGLALNACTGLFASHLIRGHLHDRTLANQIQSVVAVIALLLWLAATLWRTPEYKSSNPQS